LFTKIPQLDSFGLLLREQVSKRRCCGVENLVCKSRRGNLGKRTSKFHAFSMCVKTNKTETKNNLS